MSTEDSELDEGVTKTPVRRVSSIADVVFAGELPRRRERLIAGAVVVLAAYAGAFSLLGRLGRSAAPWAAAMAARVHDAIAVERAVDVTPPPPPPAAPARPTVEKTAAAPRSASAHAPQAKPAAPAQAGRLAAATPAPIDFTGTAFVVGTGSSYAGGKTTSAGTSRTPATGDVASGGLGGGVAVRSHARPVSLDESAWSCPWPAEADARQVDEETVVLWATVNRDGRAERVDVVSDPGFGFGAAARVCALATRFEPARDAAGQAVAALSPPIRVHFFR